MTCPTATLRFTRFRAHRTRATTASGSGRIRPNPTADGACGNAKPGASSLASLASLVLLASLALLALLACSGGSSGGGSLGGDSGSPTIVITAPIGGAALAGTTVVSATASDDRGVVAVQFQLDGVDLGARLVSSPWRIQWDTTTAADGAHVLTAFARDAAQNEGTSSAVPVVIANAASNPALTFSTFLGGQNVESVRDVFVDALGYVYVTGGTASPDFPTTAGALDRTYNGTHDVFVAEFAPDGGALVFSTFLGGPNYDRAYAIEVDARGFIYVGGRAGDGFPTTPGSLQPVFGGDDAPDPLYGAQDGFVARLSPDGSTLLWATYFGNDSGGALRDLDVDASGNVYVVGATDRPHYAVTAGSFDPILSGVTDGLVVEISADGSQVVWGSYFGGSGPDGGTPSIRVGDDGTVWLLGHTQSDDFPTTPGAYQRTRGGAVDLVLMKIAPGGATLEWATCFGGSETEFTETHGLSVDAAGVVTVAATTLSPDLPFVPASIPPPFQSSFGGRGGSGTGAQTNYPGDGFVARLAADGASLLAFTYFGGSVGEGVEGVAVDDQGRVHLSGATYSTDLPLTADALQHAKASHADAFFARLSSDLSTLEFATFLGGGEDDVGRALAIGIDGRMIGGGTTNSTDFPSTSAAFAPASAGGTNDGFVYEITG